MDLIHRACTQAVSELEDLDWKSKLPLTLPPSNTAGRDEQQDELAKDIAAMANTRGGLKPLDFNYLASLPIDGYSALSGTLELPEQAQRGAPAKLQG
jgi:hypothetical protein